MEIIFGGYFQGKREYIKSYYKIKDDEIYRCLENGKMDFDKLVLLDFENISKYIAKEKISAKTFFDSILPKLNNKIIIFNDFSNTVVSMDKDIRKWREENGLLMQLMTKEAKRVTRIYAGIPTIIKGNKYEE